MISTNLAIKKAKLKPREQSSNGSSKIFAPFRAFGRITDPIPFHTQKRGSQFYVSSVADDCVQIFSCDHLRLVFFCKCEPGFGPISNVVVVGNYVVCTNRHNKLNIFVRSKLLHSIEIESSGNICQAIAIGYRLVLLDDQGFLYCYDLAQIKLLQKIGIEGNALITSIIHPPTYLNKILAASADGSLKLTNFNTGRTIYEYKQVRLREGEFITCIEHAPALDICAFGTQMGIIAIFDLRHDRRILSFDQKASCTSLSFMTFSASKGKIMATSDNKGNVFLWDLETGQFIVSWIAHQKAVTKIEFLPWLPILMTNGDDNSLKQWYFENLECKPAVIRSRSGHSKPPTKLSFYGQNSHYLLSAGPDGALRCNSLYNDAQSFEFSQGKKLLSTAQKRSVELETLKLSQIIAISSSVQREKEWDNILTAHSGENFAVTWSWKHKAIGQYRFYSSDGSQVTAVTVSSCGNFGLLGSANGVIDIYNMQSGIKRKSIQLPSKSALICVIMNKTLGFIMTCCENGAIYKYSLPKYEYVSQCTLGIGAQFCLYHEDAELLSIASEDYGIRILDTAKMVLVRELSGHQSRLTSMAFSPDARLLIAASLDETIRVWHLPTGNIVDGFRLPKICTELAFSPKGEYIAFTVTDRLEICLWTNKSLYQPIDLRHLQDSDLEYIDSPDFVGSEGISTIEAALESVENGFTDQLSVNSTEEPVRDDSIQVTNIPKLQWKNLINIEIIKQRNKPKQPPKKPENAPFFIPSNLTNAEKDYELDDANHSIDEIEGLVINEDDQQDARYDDPLKIKLLECHQSKNYESIWLELKNTPASQIDLFIQQLRTYPCPEEVMAFLNAILDRLKSNQNYDLVQACLHDLLKTHGEIIETHCQDNAELLQLLEELRDEHSSRLNRLGNLVEFDLAMLSFLRA